MILVLVSIVAILSLLLMPILRINVGRMLTGMVEGLPTEEEELDEPSASVVLLLKALDADVEFTTVSFAELAFDENPGAAMLEGYMLGKDGLAEEALLSMVTASVLKENLPSMAELQDLDLTAVNSELYALEEEDADPVQIAQSYVEKLNEELERVGVENLPDLSGAEEIVANMYDTVCDVTGGKFTVESFICIALCAGQEDPPTTYYELATLLADSETQVNTGNAYEGIYANFGLALTVLELLATIGGYMKYVFFAMVALIAPWAFLLFFSLLHILIPNKQLTIWYVMAFGAVPALLFWLIPLALGLILKAAVPALGALFGAIGSYAWISGICFLVVWFLDLIWAHPINRQLKKIKLGEKLKKQEKKK